MTGCIWKGVENMSEHGWKMELSSYENDWKLDEEKGCWYLECVAYVRKPQAVDLQSVSIFVPKDYRNVDGSWNWDAVCGEFDAKTAPVILENGIGGYAESRAKGIEDLKPDGIGFLKEGMVYVSPGTRGKQSKDSDGNLIGKAPAGLVDLKSVVRFLKYNHGVIPGDMDRIVSMGVSAGGAMSSLLGVTGNSENYLKLLEESGAVMETTDNIFAAQCYCPIIDLEHADMAYEWMFRGVHTYLGKPSQGGGVFEVNEFQKVLSEKLADRYVEYFNGLGVKEPESGEVLKLGAMRGQVMDVAQGTAPGTADVYLLNVLQNALDKYIEKNGLSEELENEISAFADKDELNGRYKIRSREEMIRAGLPRIKPCTSFDSLTNDSAENQEFGCQDADFMHFDTVIPEVLDELEAEFSEECENLKKEFEHISGDKELQRRIYLLNPFSYIGTDEKTTMAEHFRIRVGTKDPHTSFTMAMLLALKLKNAGHPSVDYEMVWNAVHEKADFPGEFVDWVKKIAK